MSQGVVHRRASTVGCAPHVTLIRRLPGKGAKGWRVPSLAAVLCEFFWVCLCVFFGGVPNLYQRSFFWKGGIRHIINMHLAHLQIFEKHDNSECQIPSSIGLEVTIIFGGDMPDMPIRSIKKLVVFSRERCWQARKVTTSWVVLYDLVCPSNNDSKKEKHGSSDPGIDFEFGWSMMDMMVRVPHDKSTVHIMKPDFMWEMGVGWRDNYAYGPNT